MKNFNEEDIKELHALITEWALKKEYTSAQMCSYLSVMLVGTMAMKGYDEDFADATFYLMKKRFLNHPLRKR